MGLEVGGELFNTAVDDYFLEYRVGAVSYTQLDVYKRQVLSRHQIMGTIKVNVE